jgi:hypothetical protein
MRTAPDLSALIPDKLKPAAKAVVALVTTVLTVVVPVVTTDVFAQAPIGVKITLLATPLLAAFGVYGTTNVPEEDDDTAAELALDTE